MMLPLLRTLARANLNRCISLSSRNMLQQNPVSRGGKLPEKIQRAQKLFQEKNNLPVFLKGGKKDKILYYTTLSLCGVGLIGNVALFLHYIID